MIILQTIIVAFSMFSALPVPQLRWTKSNMRYCLLAFPLIGALIGALCWVWALLCNAWDFPDVLRGAGLCLLPVLLTGGIHLDGYADTCDALASHSDPVRRRQILKDPHLGAFAAIRLCVYFAAGFAFFTALPAYRGVAVLCIFCLSRTLSGIALLSFPLADGSGFARTIAEAADKSLTRNVLIALAALLCVLLALFGGWTVIPAAAVVFLWYRRTVLTQFGGVSGDLAGWFLQKAELWMLGALCLWQLIEAVI